MMMRCPEFLMMRCPSSAPKIQIDRPPPHSSSLHHITPPHSSSSLLRPSSALPPPQKSGPPLPFLRPSSAPKIRVERYLYYCYYIPADDDTKSNQTNILAEHVFRNTNVIDKSNHWSLLLYQESLAIQRCEPELNHGLKDSKELIIVN